MESLDEDVEKQISSIEFGIDSPCCVECGDGKVPTLQDFGINDDLIKFIESLHNKDVRNTLLELDNKYNIPLLEALFNPSYNTLKRLIVNKCSYIPKSFIAYCDVISIIEDGNLDVLIWYKENKPDFTYNESMMNRAVSKGRLHIVQWLRSQNPPCPWNSNTIYYAIQHNQIDTLKWLMYQKPHCPYTSWGLYSNCIRYGRLDILKWIAKIHPITKWGTLSCTSAIHCDNFEMLKWLRSQNPPCPWGNPELTYTDQEIKNWLYANGYSPNSNLYVDDTDETEDDTDN